MSAILVAVVVEWTSVESNLSAPICEDVLSGELSSAISGELSSAISG